MKIPKFLQESLNVSEINDIYNRRVIVNNIYNFIKNNNNFWAKIWIYGAWGSWKTIVLKMLEKKLKKLQKFHFCWTKDKVIFLSISDVDNIKDIHKNFIRDIYDSIGLKKVLFWFPLTIIIVFLVILFVIRYYDFVSILFKDGLWTWFKGTLFWVIILFIGPSLFALGKQRKLWTSFQYRFLLVIPFLYYKKLFWKRVTVIVDDLDRFNPKILPDLLLWLNRISTVDEGLVNIIISADPKILAEWIKKFNGQYSWGEGYIFLEKIIDIPFYLDEIKNNEKYVFWNTYKKSLIKDFSKFSYIEWFIEYLPNNIRQLKRYFRFLYTYIDNLKRFWDEEIKWGLFFFICLMKLQHPDETKSIFNEMNEQKIFLFELSNDRDENIKDFLKNIPDSIKDYIFWLWWQRIYDGDRLADLLTYYYFDNIPLLTDKEFKEKFIVWDMTFIDLEKLYSENYIKLLEVLTRHKNKYYTVMVEKMTDWMKIYSSYVQKIYNFIKNAISKIDSTYLYDKDIIISIISNLKWHEHFKRDTKFIKYSNDRLKEEELLKELVKNLHPQLLFDVKNDIKWFDDFIDEKYWEYLIDEFSIREFNHKLVKQGNFIYNIFINYQWLKQVLWTSRNSSMNANLFFSLLVFLDQIWKVGEKKHNIMTFLESEEFNQFIEMLSFSAINHRTLWHLYSDVLEKLSSDYNKIPSIKSIYEKVNKYRLK